MFLNVARWSIQTCAVKSGANVYTNKSGVILSTENVPCFHHEKYTFCIKCVHTNSYKIDHANRFEMWHIGVLITVQSFAVKSDANMCTFLWYTSEH